MSGKDSVGGACFATKTSQLLITVHFKYRFTFPVSAAGSTGNLGTGTDLSG